jgi:hypothetical protein
MPLFHCAEYGDGSTPLCVRAPRPDMVTLEVSKWYAHPEERRCARCEAKLQKARQAGWEDAQQRAGRRV